MFKIADEPAVNCPSNTPDGHHKLLLSVVSETERSVAAFWQAYPGQDANQ